MVEVLGKSDRSEEMLALALRFFSLDEKYKVNRTQNFMELSGHLKDLSDDVNEMLTVMQSGKPFRQINKRKTDYGVTYGNVINAHIEKINSFSMEILFRDVFDKAYRLGRWGQESAMGRMPHVEALAWIAYFTEWNKEEQKFVPAKTWIDYYNQHFSE